ncbi:MAG: TetR/AcrR family transcriptional regulator [Firmicutes bacterium HGW-Firmicutes-10]|nr:MAG: TetR/AcrR family transcriptional regulator [Firmicutes bacterium HGW-Firmicutes-10]
MAIKRKGNETKERILSYSKQEFYENGYNDTWVKTIAEKADMRLGNLNYYFNKKDDIVKEIYEQFTVQLYDYIESQGEYTELQKYCNFAMMFYHTVFSDEQNKKFYHEVIVNKSNYRILHELMKDYYKNIIQSLNLELSDTDFEIFILTEFGSRREIFLAYLSEELTISFDDLIVYVLTNLCKNLSVEATEITEMLEIAADFFNNNDYSHVKFLV